MSEFEDGYDAFVRLCGSNKGAFLGNAYVGNVQSEIDKLEYIINHPERIIKRPSTDKGFLAEWWHEGTFNIDAALKDLSTRAIAPDDNGIVDIILTSGEKYQVKYYKTGIKSAVEQAKSNLQRYKEYAAPYERKGLKPPISQEEYLKSKFPNDPYYLGQGRLIPTEQLKEAKDYLLRKLLEESNGGRPEQIKRYEEALKMLTDRLESADGAKSTPLTNAESLKLAELAMKEGFDPADWGLTTEKLIITEYILEQAFKAGLSAALISVVLEIAPKICGIIIAMLKDEEINAEQFKELGFAAIRGGAEGFIRGYVAGAITVACEAGKFGATLKNLDPSVIGAITAIAMNAVKNSCLIALGKINKHEFADRCCQDIVITAFSVGLGAAGTAAATSLFSPAAAVFGYMIGSFVGSVVGCFVYSGIYSCVLSFCVESGSTFFGLVEQNYEMPKEILEKIGIEVFEYETIEPIIFHREVVEPIKFEYECSEPIKTGVTFLRRGVIGVGEVGYI